MTSIPKEHDETNSVGISCLYFVWWHNCHYHAVTHFMPFLCKMRYHPFGNLLLTGRQETKLRTVKVASIHLNLTVHASSQGAFFSVSLHVHTFCTTLHMVSKLGLRNWYLALWALAVHDSTRLASPGWAKCLKGVALDGCSLWHFHMLFAPHRELHRRAMGTIRSQFKAWDGRENMPSLQHENTWYWVLSKTFKTQIPETLGQSYTTLKQISWSAVSCCLMDL